MNKKAIILFAILFTCKLCFAQNYSRNIGNSYISSGVNLLDDIKGGNIGYEKRIGYQTIYSAIIYYNTDINGYSKYDIYTFENGVSYEFLTLKRLICRTGAALYLGMEDISSTVEDKDIQKFTFGSNINLRTEIYILNRLAIFGEGKIYKSFKSEVFNWHSIGCAGIKFTL